MCPNPDLSYCTGTSVGGWFANSRPCLPGISPGTQSQSFPECFSPKGTASESFRDCWLDRPVRRPGNVLSMQSFSNSNFGSLRCNDGFPFSMLRITLSRTENRRSIKSLTSRGSLPDVTHYCHCCCCESSYIICISKPAIPSEPSSSRGAFVSMNCPAHSPSFRSARSFDCDCQWLPCSQEPVRTTPSLNQSFKPGWEKRAGWYVKALGPALKWWHMMEEEQTGIVLYDTKILPKITTFLQ